MAADGGRVVSQYVRTHTHTHTHTHTNALVHVDAAAARCPLPIVLDVSCMGWERTMVVEGHVRTHTHIPPPSAAPTTHMHKDAPHLCLLSLLDGLWLCSTALQGTRVLCREAESATNPHTHTHTLSRTARRFCCCCCFHSSPYRRYHFTPPPPPPPSLLSHRSLCAAPAMPAQSMLQALGVMLAAYLLFVYTNRDGIELPRPTQGYYYATNETQRLLAEAKRETARVAAAQAAAAQLGSGSAATAGALTQYGVALKEGDESLAATISYVHRYQQLAEAKSAAAHDADRLPPVPVHVFLAADDGTYSGMHELFYITAAMRYGTRMQVEGCRSALFGFLEKPVRDPLTWGVDNAQRTDGTARGLRKIPVLAITTGIYVTSSAACTATVMELPMFSVQSVTLIGTAGVSPVVGGGGWNPRTPPPSAGPVEASEAAANPACQQHWAPDAQKVALGSVCVTYASLLQECGRCVEDDDLTSLCTRPRCSMHNHTAAFGPCALRHPVSSFAEQMKGAMYGKPFPAPSATVREAMQVFWESNEAATDYVAAEDSAAAPSRRARARAANRPASAPAPDTVLSYNRLPPTTPILLHCAEVSTSQILAGPRSDVLCRQYTEEVFGGLYAAKDLSCVQAMEGMGVLHVLTREYPTVPAAIVRGGSNYDMFPLSRHVYHLNSTGGDDEWYVAWDQKEHYVSDVDFHRYTRASYQYSIETASAVVLNYFLSAETVLPGM
ncbi:hypothetical protein NESM_000605000 [Novymonas esmeraldas]|uniref:Uncharacterized protein n=1 Tax=Novymonas esmeraldas TaxID=1808958 RepID=A0AAW0ESE5_9TRYP